MTRFVFAALLAAGTALPALAHDIKSPVDAAVPPAFDIVVSSATTDGRLATFMMELAGEAGSQKPEAVGQLKGAKVAAYVWPTGLDPAVAGFAAGSGLLALAVTAHPDFDDTPLFDENGDGDLANDGAYWHSHWVVLAEDKACGAGLKVRDVSPGVDLLPATAPMLPIALDSPGMSPRLDGREAGCRSFAAAGVGFRAPLHEPQSGQHDDGEQGRDKRDLPEAEATGEADGAGQPHAGARCQAMDLAAGEDDQPGGEKGDARCDGLNQPDGVDADGVVLESGQVGDFDGKHGDRRRRQADQDMGAQTGRPVAPFALEADDAAERRGQQQPGRDHLEGKPARAAEIGEKWFHDAPRAVNAGTSERLPVRIRPVRRA